MTTMYVSTEVEWLEPNPFRDIENYEINRQVVDDLVNSIKKTDFWENFGIRVKPGTLPEQYDNVKDFVADMQELPPDGQIQFCKENGIIFQQDSGHHRIVAARECGIEMINVHVRDWDDDHMLVVMALENQESFRARPLTALETINQVITRMSTQVESVDNWEEFQAAGYKTFKSKKAFANAKSQGVGIKAVKAYLGENWSDMYIRASIAALKHIKSGYFTLEDLNGFPTVDAIGSFNVLVTSFEHSDVPDNLLMVMVKECAQLIVAKDRTGNTIRAAAKQFENNGNNPMTFLSTENLSKLNWQKYLKSLDLGDFDVYELVKGGSKTWTDMADAVREEIEKDVKREEEKAKFDREVEAKAAEEGISEDDARALLESETAKAEATEGEGETAELSEDGGLLEGLDDIGASAAAPTTSPGQEATAIATLLGSTLQNIAPQFKSLRGKLNEMNGDGDQSEVFFSTLAETFDAVTLLMAEHTSFKDIRARVTQLSKM